MSNLINPLDVKGIQQKFNFASNYQKTEATLGRLPKVDEIDKLFFTYVSSEDGGFREETRNIVTDDKVIARNSKPILPGVYNEWLIDKDEWKNIYGEFPKSSEKFSPHFKQALIKCILIDTDVLTLLQSEDGQSAQIYTPWSDKGMTVYKGGFLTESGYGITKEDMEKTYKLR